MNKIVSIILLLCATGITAQVPVPKADYQFRNSLANNAAADAPALRLIGTNRFAAEVVDGTPTFVSQFAAGNGLQLSPTTDVVSNGVYSIVILARLEQASEFRRLLDFKTPAQENGLYVINGALQFYPISAASGNVFANNSYSQIVLTRAEDRTVTAYSDGVRLWSVTDSTDIGLISSSNAVTFFKDNSSEDPAGAVARIRLYDRALTTNEVANLDRLPPPCSPVLNGLVSWWPAHGDARDAAGSNHGTFVENVAFAPGRVGPGFQLDGASYLETSTNGMHFGTNDFSIEGWIKTTATKAWNTICSFDDFNPALYVLGDGRIDLYPAEGSATGGYNDGRFHHFAVVRQAGVVTYYKDGQTNGTATSTQDLIPMKFRIGYDNFVGDHFPGIIDELALYRRALSTTEIEAIFVAGAAGRCQEGSVPNVLPLVSLLSPTNSALFYQPGAITLTANANDFDGSIARVEYLLGTNVIGSAASAPFAFAWTNAPLGDLTISARSIDNQGGVSLPVSVTVRMNPPNVPPSVSLTGTTNSAMLIAPGIIALRATASDSDGSVSKVEFYDGTILLGSDTTAPYEFYWLYRPAGTYNVFAKAIDNAGGTANSATVTTTISSRPGPVNNAPPAPVNLNDYVGRPFEVFFFTLTANASAGSVWGTDIYTYDSALATAAVHAGAMTNGQTGIIQVTMLPGLQSYTALSRNGVTSNPFGPWGGSYVVSALTSVQPPTVSLSQPTNGTVFLAPVIVNLAAQASDSDGTVAQVDFLANGSVVGSDTNAPFTFAWTGMPVGNYTLSARATDSQGAVANSSTIDVVINGAPVVSLVQPTNGTIFLAPATIALSASATDPNGFITRVEFLNGTSVIGTANSFPHDLIYSNVLAGTYIISVRATDNHGATTVSAPITVIANAPPTISLLNPTNGAIFLAPGNIPFSATAADSDGTIARVEFLDGTNIVGISTTAPFSLAYTNVPFGTNLLSARAIDNRGAVTATAAISVIVNAAPSASLTSPTNGTVVVAPANLSLSATASDLDGTISRVEFLDGATVVGTVTAAPFNFSYTNVAAGTRVLSARATDNRGASTTSTGVSVIVNAPPTVSLTSPANGALFVAPGNIAISAAASDSDGTIARVEFLDGTNVVGTVTAAPYNFTYANVPAGNHVLAARATDNRGATNTSAAVAVIVNEAPVVSLTAPAGGTVFVAPATISLAATASDPDGTIARVEFLDGATVVGSVTTAPYNFTFANVPAGTHVLSARATDNRGTATTSAGISVIVNAPPSVSLTSPTNGAVFLAPATLTISAVASDSDGTVARVEFLDGPTILGTATAPPYNFTYSNVAAGNHVLTARAIDNRGATNTSTAVTVIVNAAPAVSLTAPSNGAVFFAPAAIAFSASASDADGTIARVEFLNGTNVVGTATAAPYNFTLSNVLAGTYQLSARAVDNRGAAATTAAVTVTVNTLMLSIRQVSPTSVALAWPAAATGYVLEQTATLRDPASWRPATGTPAANGSNLTLTNATSAAATFYRLKKSN